MDLQRLTNSEKTVYILLAYLYGYDVDKSDINRILKSVMSTSTVNHCIKSLKVKNLIEEANNYYFYRSASYRLRTGGLFPALHYASLPENKAVFDLVRKLLNKERTYKVAKDEVLYGLAILNHGTSNAISLSFPSSNSFKIELASILLEKDYRDVCAHIPDDALKYCVQLQLDDLLLWDDKVDWDYLRQIVIDDRKSRRKSTCTSELQSSFNLYYYLGTGKMCIDLDKVPADMYALITTAIYHLYRENYESSYKLFSKAMTIHNKKSKEKSYFDSTVINYFYVMCLLLSDTETSLKKFDTLSKKKGISEDIINNLIFKPLHVYFRLHESPKINGRIVAEIFKSSHKFSALWLAWMIYTKLGIWPSGVHEPSLTEHDPHAMWLRAELMPTGMVPLNDAAAKAMGSSLFYHLRVKPVWEMRLESIIEENTSNNLGDDVEKQRDTRLIYLLEYGQIVPILQKRRKDGEWSLGRRLSAGSLKHLSDDDTELDDVDHRLMRDVNEWDYSIYESSKLVYLVGCDHVYTGTQTDLLPVSIHEDKPFLIIDKDKDGTFSITTNVEELKNDDNNKSSVFYRKNSDTDYSVYRPNTFERKVYHQILAQQKYPKEAEPLMMKLISTLGGKTEIHSNMIVDFDDLEKVDGESKLTLRCIPDHYDSYNISVSVHVFPGLVFVPGKGNMTTIAEKENKKVQIVRHMKTERKNLKQLSLKLSDLDILDEDDDWKPQTITDTLSLGIGTFLELMQWVKENPDICEMEWPEGAKIKYHPAVKASAASIGFKAKNGWFDVEGDVQINEDEVISLQKLLEFMHSSGKRRYIKVGEDEYITLSSDLSKILKRLDTVTSERRNRLQMSSSAVGLIGDVLDNSEAKINHSKVMDELRKRISDSTNIEPQVPKTLHATMRDYQEEGYDWMERVTSWGAGVCLADDMGLGKTLQTIALLLDREADGPSLVVAPASVVPNWRNELQRFAPTLSVTILNEAENRTDAINEAGSGDVVVTTYALLNIQQEQLSQKEWNIICLDEAHTIKNPNTKMSKAAMSLHAKRKVILTGTPIQNHLSELWNLFQFINPGLLGSAEQFGKKFIEPIEVNHDKERQNQLRRLISPFLLRRTKGEVIEELPEKNEITIPVELSSEEMTMYEVRRRQAEKSVLADKSVKISTLAEITRLREMACSVSLVDKKWKRMSSKVLAFIDLAESLNDSGNRALVFSQFTSFFEQVRAAMDKAKLPYLYLDGSTPISQREKLVKDFQTGKCPFFLISLKAGGLGLNLTGANYVIHLDPWWNPAIEQQATDRAYRIGQRQDVTVYHLISQHTIEEKIQRLHKTKRDLADSLLEGTDMSHALTQEELLELLS